MTITYVAGTYLNRQKCVICRVPALHFIRQVGETRRVPFCTDHLRVRLDGLNIKRIAPARRRAHTYR